MQDAEGRVVVPGDDDQLMIGADPGVKPCEQAVLAFVLPGEAVPFPNIGPTVAAGVLPGAALEAIAFADRVALGRRRLAQEPAEVDEVFLRGRAFLQFRRSPLSDELTRRHGIDRACAAPARSPPSCSNESTTFKCHRLHVRIMFPAKMP